MLIHRAISVHNQLVQATSTKRQRTTPTARTLTRLIGVSGCSGFRTWRKNAEGRTMRTIPTQARKRRPIAKMAANQLSDIGIIIQPQNSDAEAPQLLICRVPGHVAGRQSWLGKFGRLRLAWDTPTVS